MDDMKFFVGYIYGYFDIFTETNTHPDEKHRVCIFCKISYGLR